MSLEIGEDYFSPDRSFRATVLEVAEDDGVGGESIRYLDKYGEERWEYSGSFMARLKR
jgi:hypothetical protein